MIYRFDNTCGICKLYSLYQLKIKMQVKIWGSIFLPFHVTARKILTWCKNPHFQISWILKEFWSLPLNFLWKSQFFLFPSVKHFWDALWFSNCHRSKALIIRNNFHCDNTDEMWLFWVTEDKKLPVGVLENPFLEVIFEVKISALFKVFNFWENLRFSIFTKFNQR